MGEHPTALATIGHYAAAASVSYGRAYYQPSFSAVGEVYQEADPETGIPVKAELIEREPAIRSQITVDGDGWSLVLDEQITGTTFGLGTLGMPAPSRFTFSMGSYEAAAAGVMVTELIPIPRATRVRGHGRLALSDSVGNDGEAVLTRRGQLTTKVGTVVMTSSLRR